MSAKDRSIKLDRIVRFIGRGALLMAIAGLIIYSPLSAVEQDATGADEYVGADKTGPLHLGICPEEHVAFLEIILDLSASQVKEIEPILAEHHEKMRELRREARVGGRQAMRMNRVHRHECCDMLDRTEMRAKMRRQRREFGEDSEKIRKRIERDRDEFEKKLAGVLDDGQMKKLRELRELRDTRREERQEYRQKRSERRGRKL
jgi:hypothetical protein